MVKESRCNCLCFVEGTIDTISKKWALLVINALGNHQVLRYSELMNELKGISPKSLADTLAQLHRQGLIRREPVAEIPPRVQYSLTRDGRQLRKAINPLFQWALTRGKKESRHCVTAYRTARAHILKGDSEEKERKTLQETICETSS
jgi:DNA-binding HxlR family transcriptional regulator